MAIHNLSRKLTTRWKIAVASHCKCRVTFLEFSGCESLLSYRVAMIKYCYKQGLVLTELFQEPTLDFHVETEKSRHEVNTSDKPPVGNCLKSMSDGVNSVENNHFTFETKDQYFYQPTLKLVMEGMASKSEGSLMDLFMSFGKVVKLSKAGDVTFVTFFRETEGLYKAVRHLNSLAIGGSKLKVQVVTEGRCATVSHKWGSRIEDIGKSHLETKTKGERTLPVQNFRNEFNPSVKLLTISEIQKKEMHEWKTVWD